jgi:HSP90 family molecular chaperone
LRFIKGVVDCDNIPLNVSREMTQDSILLDKISTILKKRILRYLTEQSNKDNDRYVPWYKDFNIFIKEGIA